MIAMSEALSRADSQEAIYRAAIDALMRSVRIDRAAVRVLDSSGVMRFVAWHGLSDEYRRAMSDHSPWTGGETPAPIVVGDVTTDAAMGDLRATVMKEGIGSLVCIPLASCGRTLGKFMIYRDRPSEFTAKDIETASGIGSLIAFAVERWRAAEELSRSAQRFRAIFDQAAVGIAEVSRDGDFLAVNRRLCEILGYTPDELANMRFHDITYEPDLGVNLIHFQRMMAAEIDTYTIGKRYRRKDGEVVWANLSVGAVRDPEGKIERLVSVVEDITERKRLEERLNQAQRMESIGRLAGGVAHDLNNLLTVMTGYASLAEQGMTPADPRRTHIQQVLAAASSASGLTRQLLAFARKQVVTPVSVPINDVLRRYEPLVRRLLRDDIDIRMKFDPEAWDIRADPGQVEQVVMNLAANAQDAMPEGGLLTVQTLNVRVGGPTTAWPADLPAGEYVMLRVRDTGVGMDEPTMRHIFEPFFTTKPMGAGTGLGLATVYAIVHQSGGTIHVRSEPGKGATFDLYWPRSLTPSVTADDPRHAPGSTPSGQETVLVVEDQPAVRGLVSDVLRGMGYSVLEAQNGEDATKVASDWTSSIQLLITDAVMPRMGGPELAKKLSATRPDMRVLMMSGYTGDSTVRRGVERGSIPFLAKPFSPDELARAVRAVLEARKPTD